MRRSPKVAEVLPILYLRGLSTGDFRPALQGLLGEEAAGLSPTNITRLTAEWEKEYQAHRSQSLADKDYVYVWVDGIHFNVRLEDDRLCTLVMIGARLDGTKELVAIEDGYRESSESWLTLLRDSSAVAWPHHSSRSVTALWASGPPLATCGRRRRRLAAGATRSPTCSTSCRSDFRPRPRAGYTK